MTNADSSPLQQPDPTDRYEALLSATQPDRARQQFVLGVFDRRVTILSQQTRAFNLVYLLHKRFVAANKKPDKVEIAVIGGGIAGVTAAACALKLGYHVSIVEKRSRLFHIQAGCDTRWIHPHINEWPSPGWSQPNAGLPFFTWRESTASELVRNLLAEWKTVSRLYERATKESPEIILRAKKYAIEYDDAKAKFKIDCKGENFTGEARSLEQDFDAIIFAVGFGTERKAQGSRGLSYWRNDDLEQVSLNDNDANQHVVVIFGAGDGGLTDVCRGAISGFRPDYLVRELFSAKEIPNLLVALRHIKLGQDANWASRANQSLPPSSLYSALSKLTRSTQLLDEFNELRRKIEKRLRHDTRVTLYGERDFATELDAARPAFLHAFIVFLLKHWNFIDYKKGCLQRAVAKDERFTCSISKNRKGENVIKLSADVCIQRYGTDPSACLNESGCFGDLTKFKADYAATDRSTLATPLWPFGWWSRNSLPAFKRETEFVPPASVALATTFAATLSGILSERLKRKAHHKSEFRLCIHRVVEYGGEAWLQQVSHYRGVASTTRLGGLVGRTFPVSGGIIGLAYRTGQTVSVRRGKGKSFDRLHARLQFDNLQAMNIHESVRSILSIPIFAADGGIALVLFMDSFEKAFFKSDLVALIWDACNAFTSFVDGITTGTVPDLASVEWDRSAPRSTSVSEFDQELDKKFSILKFINGREPLKFRSLQRYDISWTR